MPLDFDIITGLNTSNSEILRQDTAQRLADIMAVKPDFNSGGVIMPNVPTKIGGNPIKNNNASPEVKTKSALDSWLTDTKRSDKDFNSGAGTENIVNAKGTEKYLDQAYGYNPDRDNEDFYAKQQSWYSQLPKAILLKLPALTLSKVGTGIGFLAGLVDPNNWGENYIANAADNGLSRAFDGLEDNIKNDWMPIFQETSDQGKGFFRRAFTDVNFWTDDVTDGIAFLASAYVPGMAISKIGAGIRVAELLAQTGIAAENGVLGNLGLAKLAGYMRNAQKIATGIDKTLITALNTTSEAMWEAKSVKDSIMDSLKGQLNPQTGQVYTDPELRAKAGVAAQGTFLANAAILSLSNAWETNLLYKALGKGERQLGRRAAQAALGEEFTEQTSKTALGRVLNSSFAGYAKEGLKGIGVEGFYEENAQLAVQRIYDGTAKTDNFFSQILTQTGDALVGNDTEASMNIGIGGLIGLGGGVAGNAFQNNREATRAKATIDYLNATQQDWMKFGNIYQKNADGTTQLDSKGNPIMDVNKLKTTIENWNKMTDLKLKMDNTANPDLHKIIQKEAYSNFVKAHINAGIEDQLNGKLNGLLNVSDDQLVQFGFDPKSNADRAADIADLQNYTQQLIDLNETINADILNRNTTGEDNSTNAKFFEARKSYLFTLGARQLALQQQSGKLNLDLDNLKARLGTVANTDNTYVDQLNYLKERILSQRRLIEQIDNYTLDGEEIDKDKERQELSDLGKQFNDFRDTNRQLYDKLVIKAENGRETYQYLDESLNTNILSRSIYRKASLKAQIDNAAATVNREFYSVANTTDGQTYFRNKIEGRIDAIMQAQQTGDTTINPADNNTVPGKKVTVKMKDKDVELEEGKVYIGQLSKTQLALAKGVKATVFNNDKIKIISINDDGTITITINDDAPVTFTAEELAEVSPILKYDSLTNLQKFYIANRNNVYQYRVPIKYNRQTKQWETGIVSGRLSYDKKNNILNLAYKVGDTIKYIEFNPKFVKGFADIRTLPSEQQAALAEQQAKMDALRTAQFRLFENLINNTDTEIDEQKRLANENHNDLLATQDRLNQLTDDLNKYREELELTDKSKINDKRTKAGRINRIIKKLEAEVATVSNQLERLRQERDDISKRQEALAFMMDEYLTAYDNLIDTNDPVTRAELNYLEHREGELASTDSGARYTIDQIQEMLNNSIIESDAVELQITQLEAYLKDLNSLLSDFKVRFYVATLFDQNRDINSVRTAIRDILSNPDTPTDELRTYTNVLNKINRNPKYFEDVKFLIDEIKSTVDIINRAKRGNGFMKTRIQQLSDNLEIKQEISEIRQRKDYLKNVFAGLAKEFEKEKAAAYVREQQKNGKTTIVAKTVEDAKNAEENNKLFSEFITEPPIGNDINSEEKAMFWDTDKPVITLNNNPLYKSADSHFPDGNINPQEYTQRFFKFSSTVNLDGSYYIMPVTESNDGQFGENIRFNNEVYKDDIKFVIVKKINNKFVPIDVEGNTLTDPNTNNIVYSSFYGHPDLLSNDPIRQLAWAKDNFAIKQNMTDAQILTKINEFLSFREDVKRLTKQKGNQYIQITSKSNGYQNRVPKDTVTGLPQELSVEGRLTSKNPNWTDVDLIVSTLGGVAGNTNIKLKPGRLAIRKNGNVYQVYNRQLNNSEKQRIKRLLTKLVYSFGRKQEYDNLVTAGAVITQEEADSYTKDINTANNITQYLSSILYWDRPITGTTRTTNQFQIDRGYLRRGSLAEELAIPFTVEGLEQLDTLLDGVYHQVANRLVNTTTPYNILDIDPNTNDLTFTSVDSYKQYLMEGNQPVIYTNVVEDTPDIAIPQMINSYISYGDLSDRAVVTERVSKNIIIASNMTLTNGEYVISFRNPTSGVEFTTDFTKNGDKLTITKNTLIAGDLTDEKLKAFGNNVTGVITDLNVVAYNINGKEGTGYQRIDAWRKAGYTFDLNRVELVEKKYDTTPKDEPPPRLAEITPPAIQDPIVPNTAPTPADRDAASVLIKNMEGLGFADRIKRMREIGVISDIYIYGNRPIFVFPIGDGKFLPFYRSSQGTSGKEKGKWFPMFGFGKRNSNDSELSWLIKGSVDQMNNDYYSKDVTDLSKVANTLFTWEHSIDLNPSGTTNPFYQPTFKGSEEVFNEKIFGKADLGVSNDLSAPLWINSVLESYKGQQTEGTTPLVVDNDVNPPSAADLLNLLDSQEDEGDDNYRLVDDEESDYVKENQEETRQWFETNLPQFTVTFTDYLIKNKAWGQFKNGAIHIYNEAPKGTGFHEAFEGVWASSVSESQREALINEFKKRPNYQDILKKTARVWKGLSEDQLIKETLAEEFRDYVLNGTTISGQGKRNNFFRKLWSFIRSLFGLTTDQLLTIDELFNKINRAGYANAPIVNYDSAVASFKNIAGVSQEITSQAIEGITANFFIKLFSKQENTESLFSKKANFTLLNDILTEVRDQLDAQWNIDAAKRAGILSGVFTKVPANNDETKQMLNNLTAEEAIKFQAKMKEFVDTNQFNYRDKLTILKQFKAGVLPIFYDYLRQYGFVVKTKTIEELDVDDTNDEEVKDGVGYNDPLGIRDSITIDTRNTANTTVRLLVASLRDYKYNSKGVPVDNKNGLDLPKLVDYDKTINTLFNELQGIIPVFKNGVRQDPIDMMFDKLDNKYQANGQYKNNFVWLYDLKRKLKYIDKSGDRVSLDTLKEEDVRLRVAFTKSFSKSKNNPLKLILSDSNNIYAVDPISSANTYRIREAWNNNAKASTQRSNDFLRIENNSIVFNSTSPKFSSLLRSNSLIDKVEMLRGLGITFSVPDTELTQRYQKTFGDAVLRISEFISRGELTTYDDLFSKQNVNGPVNSLLQIELDNNAENLSLQYRNPAGENEYSIVNTSNISNTLNSLKNIDNIVDFVLTNPQYGQVDPKTNTVILNTYQQGSELLRLGGTIFDKNGRKKKDITYNLIGGIAQATEADGEVTSKLKRTDKVLQELFHMGNGTYYTIINSDKSSEFGLNTGEFVSMFNFTVNSQLYNQEVRRIYTNHLRDEVNSIIELSKGVNNNIQYYSDNQKVDGKWALAHFRDIITSESNLKKLQTAVQNRDTDTFVNDSSVQQEIANYLLSFVKDQQDTLLKLGIIERLTDGTYTSNALSTEQMNRITNGTLNPKSFNQASFDNLTRYLFVNHQIAVREQHKLIYGHPTLYKDLPKRSNGATSTKESIVDSPEINGWLDKNYPRLDGKVRTSETISTFKNISYADANVMSFYFKDIAEGMYKSMIDDVTVDQAQKRIGATFEKDGTLKSLILDKKGQPTGDIKAYILLNEADAQAYILPDFYRDLLFLSAKLSMDQQRQINYEIAYERQARSKEGREFFKDYTVQEKKDGLPQKDADILLEGNPGYVLPVLKPQYFGYAKNSNLMHTVFLKHSVKPLFYRFVEGTSMESKYANALSQQIDIIGYESGEKVGNVFNNKHAFDPYYNDNGSTSSVTPPIQELYTKYYGIQVEMAAKLKELVIRGTQMTKIIMSNLFENGVPKRPEYQSIINDYVETLTHIITLGKQELLTELGLRQLEDGSYITTDLKRLVSTLRDEAVKRDLPSNIVEAFQATLDTGATGLVYKFDSFSNRDKIDNILNSIVDSRVISQHMHGKPAVQAAVTGQEKLGSNRKIFYLKDGIYTEANNFDDLSDVEKKTAKIGSSDLKFYHIKNGRTQSMEVLLPHWFKELYGKDTVIDISTLDPRLLQLIGFRIPTQGMNSIDSIIVKGFLNPEEGDTVVVPSEIVGKSGSDFDIDKLNIYIPNYKMVNGKPVYIEYTGDNTNKEALQNRLIEIMTNLLTLPDNYRQLVVPNGVDTLKEIEALLLDIRGASKSKAIPFTALSEWNYMNETRERFLVGKQLVGIGALHITNNAVTQIANTFLTGFMDGETINIRFPHNVNEKGQLYLSAIKDKAGQWISELLSEALSGFVDAAKDPFVFELNMNPATAGTYFYLMRLGVPVKSVALFHTQPIIMDYIANQQANESMLNKINGEELSKAEIVALTQSDYIAKAFPGLVKDERGNNTDIRTLFNKSLTSRAEIGDFGYVDYEKQAYRQAIFKVNTEIERISSSFGEYKESDLTKNIRARTDNKIDDNIAKYQLVALNDFLKHQQEANALSTFINAVSYDTARTKNIIENVIQQFNYNKVIDQDFIGNTDDVLNTTFLGEMKRQKDEVPKMFQNYFVSLHPNAQAIFQPIYRLVNDPNLSMIDDSKKEFLNRYQNFFLNYLLHTVKIRNPFTNSEESLNKYYNLFFGMDSFAHQLKKAQLKYPENKILQELFPIVSTDRSNTDNVKLFTSKLSTYESNSIIESAVNLLEESQTDPELRTFVNNLAVFSIIQSGVQVSPISYTKVLPNELYATLVGNIFDKFTDTASDINPAIVYKQFFQNNNTNGILVPSIKPFAKGTNVKDGILSVKGFYRIASYDYIVRREDKLNPATNKPYTFAERQEMIKNKQWEDLYSRTLYEKYLSDDNNAYFRPINKLGNRIFATEVYKTDTNTMTSDQIMLSGINGYIDETIYESIAQITDREAIGSIITTPNQITFIEHPESGYRGRTIENAKSDVTIAIAVDFESAGEKLTKSSVISQKKTYIPVDISKELKVTPELVKYVADFVRQSKDLFSDGVSVNIAGNGIYTMRGRYTQKQLDDFTYDLIRQVNIQSDINITSINTGGQTGLDEAGAKAGLLLGIPTIVRAPKDWVFRNIEGKDIANEQAFKARFDNIKPSISNDELNNTKEDLDNCNK